MTRNLSVVVLTMVLTATLLAPSAFAWGDNGHSYVNQIAAQKMPASMPAFLREPSAVARIAYLGPEPDRWRGSGEYALNQSQAPDHFIDLERVAGLGELPRGRYDFYKLLYEKRAATHSDDYLPERVGLQPYIAMEVYERLKAAFRAYRALQKTGKPTLAVQQDIVFYSGWLGHYVADAAQPMHTSINYDGWVESNPRGYTTQKGFHAKFETAFVDRNITAASFAGLVGAPVKLEDPFRDYQRYLADSHSQLARLYELDKLHGFDGAGSAEGLQFVKARLAAGTRMLLNLWYTAWLSSAE